MVLMHLLPRRRNPRHHRPTPHPRNRTNGRPGYFRVRPSPLSLPFPPLLPTKFIPSLLTTPSALNSLALLLVWLFVPGTERHIVTMEEMNYVFGVATRKHMRYQRDEVGPWFWQKYVRMKREVKEPGPLYDYARGGVS